MADKQQTLRGFSITERELTEEEANREITIDRIREFHYEVGEDFLDICNTADAKVFAGFIAHKYKDRAAEICNIMNQSEGYLEINSFKEFYEPEYNEEEDIDQVYFDYVEFVNTTKALKKRDNQMLIQVTEYYQDGVGETEE